MMARKTKNQIKTNKLILIGTEGEKTEPNYFKQIQQLGDVKEGYKLEVKWCKCTSPYQMVEWAIKERNNNKDKYEKIWLVFDHDQHQNLDKTFDLAQKNDINIAFSAISFEVWILLHFKYTTTVFHNSEEVIKEIKKNNILDSYNKNYPKLYDNTKEHLSTARSNAQKLRTNLLDSTKRPQNPFVDVDLLIDEILQFEK